MPGKFEFTEQPVGGVSIDEHGIALTDEVLDACAADAVLLGAVGGPKWDTTDPDAPRPEQGLLGMRKGLGLFANLRPVKRDPRAARRQPAAARDRRGTDMLVVRELTGGIYFGEQTAATASARHDDVRLLGTEIERIARVAFERRAVAASTERRQGERARDLAALARGRQAGPAAEYPTSSSTTCWSTTPRCSSSRARATST